MSLRIFRISNVFSWSVAILLGSALFWVSQSVQRQEESLRRLSRQVNLELEAIRVLEAEWDYLNSPVRLETLADTYLPVENPESLQVTEDISDIPEAAAPVVPSVKPIPVSLSATPPSDGELAPASTPPEETPSENVIQNSDRQKFNALLEGLDEGGGF